MKWVFRSILLVVIVFFLTMIIGLFRPAEISAETVTPITADPEDIFPYFNNLENHIDWSPWIEGDPDITLVYGGADSGRGQSMAWRSEHPSVLEGSQEIKESQQPFFVRSLMVSHQGESLMTYAISESEDLKVEVLISMESSLGGFPYVQRLFASKLKTQMDAQVSRAGDRLKRLVESDLELDGL